MKKVLIVIIVFSLSNQLFSQNYKFGKVSKEELQEKSYKQDSSANAVVLYKKRRTYYDYTNQEGWVLITKINERIKIYNREGFKWATKKINLYIDDEDENVSIKAYTFNLENDKVHKIKLKKSEVFLESINKYWECKKFTMPNLKEGSVIEWEYTIRSPYYWRIDEMVFQQEIPIKHIESKVEIPEYFIFKNQSQGYYPVNLVRNTSRTSITFSDKTRTTSGGFSSTKTTFKERKIEFKTNIISSILDNVTALKKEPFVNNMNNYKSLLKFELTATKFPNSVLKSYNSSWADVTKTIFKSSNFGGQLKKTSHFKEDINTVVNLSEPSNIKIGKIFNFIKSRIKWNGYYGKYTSDGVKKAFREGVGNVAEVNLNLIILLRECGLDASPVLVSTRDNGVSLFPTSEGFNYVVVGVNLEGKTVLLDATEQNIVPNTLPLRAMNWKGRIVRKDGSSDWVDLISKQYAMENSAMKMELTDEGLIEGMCRITYSNYKALEYRNKFLAVKNDDIAKKLEEKKEGIEIQDYKIKNKSIINKSVIETFKFSSEDLVDIAGDKIYFKPLFFNSVSTNPFKLDKRDYPIDFGTPLLNKNFIHLKIPTGYTVENLPEDINVQLPNNYGSYKFKIISSADEITISSQFKINTAIFPVENYSELKEMFNLIINKNKEQIVLKKV